MMPQIIMASQDRAGKPTLSNQRTHREEQTWDEGSSSRQKKFFSIGDLARLFELTVQGIHLWIRMGKIRRFTRTSKRGRYRIPRVEVVRLLKSAWRPVPGLWTPSDMGTKKILVIDDYPPILEIVKKAMGKPKYPFEVTTARDIGEGLVLAAKVLPDVIVLDYFASLGGSGDQALGFIKQAKAFGKVKVIGMSAFPREGRKMLGAGADEYLAKPFALEELKDAILRQTHAERRAPDRRKPLRTIISDTLTKN